MRKVFKALIRFAVFIIVLSSCKKRCPSGGSYTQGSSIQGNFTNIQHAGTTSFSEARSHLAAAGIGNKIVFAGGYSMQNAYSKTVDIYDVATNTWTTAQLPQAKMNLVAAAAGNKIVFGGGLEMAPLASKTVDIYDVTTNTWGTARLSEERYNFSAAAAGNKIVFAGGTSATTGNSKTVDIYDVVTNTWTTAQLREGRRVLAVQLQAIRLCLQVVL